MSKLTALAAHLGVEEDEIWEQGNSFNVSSNDYLVLTYEEIEEMALETVSIITDEIVEFDIPERYQRYFDKELYIEENLGDPADWIANGIYDEQWDDEDDVRYFIFET